MQVVVEAGVVTGKPLVAADTQFRAGAELLGGLASNPREPQASCIASVLRNGCGQHMAGRSPLSYKEAPHGSQKGMLELNSALRQMLSVDLLEDLRMLLACGVDGTPIMVGSGGIKDTTTVLPYVVARAVAFRMAALGAAAATNGDERRLASSTNGRMVGRALQLLEAIIADDDACAAEWGAQQAYEHLLPAFIVKVAQYTFWRDQNFFAQWDPVQCAPVRSPVSVCSAYACHA